MPRHRGAILRVRPGAERRRRPVEEDWNANHIQMLFGREAGKDIYVCGTGTSLLGFDWGRLRDRVTIALNEAVKMPGFEPTYHLFSDGNLVNPPKAVGKPQRTGDYGRFGYSDKTSIICQGHSRRNFLEKTAQPVEVKRRIYQFGINYNPPTCKPDDDSLFLNNTVATAGIMLAYKLGARRVFLLGVDGYKIKEGVDGTGKEVYYCDGSAKPPERRKVHFSGAVENSFVKIVQDRHLCWVKQMAELRAWLHKHKAYQQPWPLSNVYQTSTHSPIEAWEKIPLDSAIEPPL